MGRKAIPTQQVGQLPPVLESRSMRFSAAAVTSALKLTFRSLLENPATLLLCLGAVVLTTFFRCVFFGCDISMQSGWVFVKELIAPGLVVGFVALFLWNLWQQKF